MTDDNDKVIVVGAGLSGLTAALNLARGGKEVVVYEKFGRPGGIPLAHPAVDVTPMEPGPLGEFIGVDLVEPYVKKCDVWNTYCYDYKVAMDVDAVNLHCVERGHRKTALDVRLYDLCLEEGVEFEFDKPMISQGDFARLPRESIIACGLYPEAFEALRIPYQKVFGYLGKGKAEPGTSCGVWFHDYVLDYAYYGRSNSTIFALYFAREPVKESEFETWCERQLLGQEGLECQRWDYYEGLVPTSEYNVPRMFVGDKILAGTLSGMMDPFALFGVHGSLVSGKLAAMAHFDKARAYGLFKHYTRFFNRNLFIRRIREHTPTPLLKKVMGPQVEFMQRHADMFTGMMNNFFKALPGYKDLPV